MPTRVLIYAPVLWPKQGLPRGRSSRIPKNSVPGAGTPAPSLGIDGAARPGTPFRRLLLDRLLARRGGGPGGLRRGVRPGPRGPPPFAPPPPCPRPPRALRPPP